MKNKIRCDSLSKDNASFYEKKRILYMALSRRSNEQLEKLPGQTSVEFIATLRSHMWWQRWPNKLDEIKESCKQYKEVN